MDNPARAEHGFSKGELTNLGIWVTLGMAKGWNDIPASAWRATREKDKARLMRFLDFRGNVTGVYYAQPRSRRWGLFLYSLAYLDKYAKMPTVMARRALGAMFAAEVVAHPARYPSLTLPNAVPAEGAESAVALHLNKWIEKHPWTLVEDKYLRDAVNGPGNRQRRGLAAKRPGATRQRNRRQP